MRKKKSGFTFFTILLIVTLFAGNLRTHSELKEIEGNIKELENENIYLQEQIVIKDSINVQIANEYNDLLADKVAEVERLEDKLSSYETPSRSLTSRGIFEVTCYDLSKQSTGKVVGDAGYGITASGFDLRGHTWETARAIAVDRNVIPLGSKVRITFTNDNYSKYNGIYTAVDTGGAIKGNKIDFFLGDFNQEEAHQSCWDFGRTEARIEIIKE